MKTNFIYIIFIGFFNFCYSQTINVPSNLNISEGKELLDDVPRDGFSVELAGGEKDIIKAFEDFLENRSKAYSTKSFFKKVSGENILVPQFSDQHFNLNAQVRESETIKLWYWVNFGGDDFVNSSKYPSESQKCKELLKDFAQEYFSSFINTDMTTVRETMANSRDNLKGIIDDVEDLTEDQAKELKDKEKLEKKKQKLEIKLSELQVSIAEKDAEIEKMDANIELISTKISSKIEVQQEIESKITDQERTLKELEVKLSAIKNF